MKIAFFWDVVTGGLVVGTNIFEESVVSIFRLEECPESGARPVPNYTESHPRVIKCNQNWILNYCSCLGNHCSGPHCMQHFKPLLQMHITLYDLIGWLWYCCWYMFCIWPLALKLLECRYCSSSTLLGIAWRQLKKFDHILVGVLQYQQCFSRTILTFSALLRGFF